MLARRRSKACYSFMPLQIVTLCHSSTTKARKLFGRLGTYAILTYDIFSILGIYPTTLEDFDLDWRFWRSLSSQFMTDPTQLLIWMKPGLSCSPQSRSYESISQTRAALLQPSGLVMSGPRQSSVSQKQRTLRSGNGRSLVRNGRWSGSCGRCKCYKLDLLCIALCSYNCEV